MKVLATALAPQKKKQCIVLDPNVLQIEELLTVGQPHRLQRLQYVSYSAVQQRYTVNLRLVLIDDLSSPHQLLIEWKNFIHLVVLLDDLYGLDDVRSFEVKLMIIRKSIGAGK